MGVDRSPSSIADRARAVLAEKITESWRAAVASDLAAKPFTSAEWANLAALEGWKGQQVLQRHPELAYGSTILAVAATTSWLLCMQLGDGDIFFVDSEGEVRGALPKGDQVVPKQTPSLWRQDAAADFRVQIYVGLEDLPALIFAATDGYAESCESDRDLMEAARNYLGIVRDEGMDKVEHRLNRFLDHASWSGRGDDITVGLISRLERMQKLGVDAVESGAVRSLQNCRAAG